MNLTFSLAVLYLLYLKGLFGQTDSVSFLPGSVCAPVGSAVALQSKCVYVRGIFQLWKLRINNTETLADPSKDSRYRYFKDEFNRCYLTIHGLKETDAGTYITFIYREGNIGLISRAEFTVHVTDLQVSVDSDHVTEGQNVTLTCKTSCPPKQTFTWFKNGVYLGPRYSSDQLHVSAVNREDSSRYSCALQHFEQFPSAEKLLNVTHVAYESPGIITLSLLLIPVVLLLGCAALWMIRTKRQNLKRPEGKENENVYENVSTPFVTFDPEEKVKSVNQKEEVQYSCVHFSKFTNGQCSASSEKEAEVQYAEITVQHHNNGSKY